MSGHVHIIGAGMAGLAAAVRLAHMGPRLTVYEAAPRAGGRCRSYHDPQLDCVIDNGNHLLLSGNTAVRDYLAEIGASDRLAGPTEAAFPFVDVTNGARWCVQPGAGAIPWWIFDAKRRVPQTTAADYLSVLRVLRAGAHSTMADCVGTSGALYRSFWEPLTVGAINTAPKRAAAALMRPVLRETFMKGSAACRPLIARESLADTFVDPALATLARAGVNVRLGTRVRALHLGGTANTALDVDGTEVTPAPEDIVILAVPPWIAETLVPDLRVPPPGEPIVNVHFRLPQPVTPPGTIRIIGIVGGCAQWVFVRGGLASVTISAAGDVVDQTAEMLSAACWRDVALALELQGQAEPPARVIKERRATFAQTPETQGLRPETVTNRHNLLLAGDWTATGLPATIEGALRSGFKAAARVQQMTAADSKAA